MNQTSSSTPKSSARTILLVVFTMAVVVLLALLQQSGFLTSGRGGEQDEAESSNAKITRISAAGTDSARLDRPRVTNSGESGISTMGSGLGTSVTQSRLASDLKSTEPLHQEAYIAALMAQLEGDGKDNALLHYALAFEMAPPNPTPEQAALIKLVMEEGWDHRAEPLLPYLLEWQRAFDKIHEGAGVGYARGVGFEMGPKTPVPNFLMAQNAAKMLAVHSRYLESQGLYGEALKQVQSAMTMGSHFNSADNLMISHLIGTAIGNVGSKQLSHFVASNVLSADQLQNAITHLQMIEQGQANIQNAIDSELQITLSAIRQIIEDPVAYRKEHGEDALANALGNHENLAEYEAEYRREWAELSDEFSKPYWERENREGAGQPSSNTGGVLPIARPNFAEAEVRFLTVHSKVRQQQVDLAVQRYKKDFGEVPRDIGALVSQNYIPAEPVDPFTGREFTYRPVGEGRYELYGNGPIIHSQQDPSINYSPTNGTFSPGVIRTR